MRNGIRKSSRHSDALLLLTGLLLPAPAHAECVDVNAAPSDDLRRIVHIDEDRAAQIVDGRPWPDVRSLTQVHGIGPARVADIEDEGLACVGHEVPAGARAFIRGRAVVWDGDTLEVAGERVRLIGIDAPEGNQMCQLDGLGWPCGALATAAMYQLVGTEEVSCDVYGRDQFERALAVCFRGELELNREIVRRGWAAGVVPRARRRPGAGLQRRRGGGASGNARHVARGVHQAVGVATGQPLNAATICTSGGHRGRRLWITAANCAG